jgi:penicillin-binding protein 1A
VWASREKTVIVPNTRGQEKFVVHNDEGNYTGSNTLTGATTFSDNSIYAEVGLKVGTKHIAALAHRMGITTPLSPNPAMTIGGLTAGVTPLDMAHAYETIAHGGRRVTGTLAEDDAPVGIQEVESKTQPLQDGSHRDKNQVRTVPVLPPEVATTETSMLETVLQDGTGRAAAIGQFAAGKTGTTSNYGDAWFVGWDSKYTVAVWVGFPSKLIPMTTDFDGGPVLGGTYPALIWHDFMIAALQIDKERAEHASSKKAGSGEASEESPTTRESGSTSSPPTPAGGGKANAKPSTPTGAGNEAGGGANAAPERAPATPAPAHEAPSAPSAAPAAPASPSSPSPTGGVSAGG